MLALGEAPAAAAAVCVGALAAHTGRLGVCRG